MLMSTPSVLLRSLSPPLSLSLNPPSTTYIYTLSLHDALPISVSVVDDSGKLVGVIVRGAIIAALAGDDEVINGNGGDRKSTRLNSSHVANSYAVFCLKKKNKE